MKLNHRQPSGQKFPAEFIAYMESCSIPYKRGKTPYFDVSMLFDVTPQKGMCIAPKNVSRNIGQGLGLIQLGLLLNFANEAMCSQNVLARSWCLGQLLRDLLTYPFCKVQTCSLILSSHTLLTIQPH